MLSKLEKIFKKKEDIIIGAIHFPPLLGYSKFPGFKIALKNALADLKALEKGGVDGIIVENNYDIPHRRLVGPEIVASMTYLTEKIKKATALPVGISVLWNDYQAALSIAKVLNLEFIRVPVFVDKVKTSYGVMKGDAKQIIKFKKHIQSDNVLLFTDIHVKHSQLLSKNMITQSAKLAIRQGSDALIITGAWTGEAPDLGELTAVKMAVGHFPIFCGSGVGEKNVKNLFQHASGAIVSTSLKSGTRNKNEVNLKSYSARINPQKVKRLISQTIKKS